MLFSILGAVTGLAGPISNVISKITDLKIMRAKADSDVARHLIDQQIEELHDKRAVLVAEAGNRTATILNVSIRSLLALNIIVLLSKVFIWDKVVGAFVGCRGPAGRTVECVSYGTDGLDPNLWWVVMAVIGFYFITTWKK